MFSRKEMIVVVLMRISVYGSVLVMSLVIGVGNFVIDMFRLFWNMCF